MRPAEARDCTQNQPQQFKFSDALLNGLFYPPALARMASTNEANAKPSQEKMRLGDQT